MRKIIWLPALLVAFASAPLTATTPATAIPTHQEVDEAVESLSTIEAERLLEDKDYALAALQAIDVVRRSTRYEGEFKTGVDALLAAALTAVGREAEAFEVAAATTRASPGITEVHIMAFLLGTTVNAERALQELEHADRSLTTTDSRKQFADAITAETVQRLRQLFFEKRDDAALGRSAEALLRFGWPDDALVDQADDLRLDAIKARLGRRDLEGAARMSALLRSPSAVLRLIVDRRFDGIVAADQRTARLQRAIADHDAITKEALAGDPNSATKLLQRAQQLRAGGKEAEALALLLPKTRDLAALEAMGEDGFWLVNEAAYALSALQRGDEAVALTRRLLALGIDKHPQLISMAINLAELVGAAGHDREAGDYAAKLFADHADLANDYGKMWMWSGAACGYALAGDVVAAAPWLKRLRESEIHNPAALTRALLCADDIAGAAAVTVRRLNDKSPDQALVALQRYAIKPSSSARRLLLEQRLAAVMERPEVRAAVEARGRVLTVPLSQIYWGLI